mmetsp:Transcript_19732/g.29292  ORF Transcript_19732/g.29292 Transcript_19732/m.29292 type:complete len:177 (+) Transcript_19732:73-603(+)
MFLRFTPLLLLLSTAFVIGDDDGAEKKKRKGKMVMSVEKGFKCEGGGSMSGGFKKECEGGMKHEFSGSCGPKEMVETVVSSAHDDLKENYFPDVDTLMPSDDDMDEFDAMAMLADGEDYDMLSKTFTFGGKVELEWGCKVKYSFKNGKVSKSNDCGFKLVSQSGKKEAKDVEVVDE